MDTQDFPRRRLAAILAADIAGYSKLMGEDEAATVRDLKGHQGAILPMIAAFGGRVIDTAGDGILAEFPSVMNATECAVRIQTVMHARNEGVAEHRRMLFRIGINLGDVIHDDQRIYGDGINVAARLENIAEPGGICISRQVFDQVNRAVRASYEMLGPRVLKNIAQPVEVFSISPSSLGPGHGTTANPSAELEQQIRFCTAQDGIQLAWSTIGHGPPVVKTGNWLTHLEHDLQSPVWRGLYRELAKNNSVVRYDSRGTGLSDRDTEELTFEALVADLEAVVAASRIQKFALLGISQGCAVSIAYASRHPERISHLVLYGGYVQGWRRRKVEDREAGEAMVTLIRHGWGKENHAFRQIFTSRFIPGAAKEVWDWYNELQRVSVTGEMAARIYEAVGDVDVTSLLPRITAPTLVLHARDDALVPFESGRRLAAGLPNARFVSLDSRNHMFLESDPAFKQFFAEVRRFLAC